MLHSKESILPKMPCFQDLEEESLCQLAASCPVYEDINAEEVIAFAEKEIGKCAHEIYFGDVSVLTLKEISCECKKTANIIE